MALSILEEKVLRQALHRLEIKENGFICHAIRDAVVPGFSHIKVDSAKYRLRAYVRKSLSGYSTLGIWMSRQHNNLRLPIDVEDEVRIAWVKWMLGEEHAMTPVVRKQLELYARNKGV